MVVSMTMRRLVLPLAALAVPLVALAIVPTKADLKLVGWHPEGKQVAVRIETVNWEGDEETGEGKDVTELRVDVIGCGGTKADESFEVMTREKQTKKDRAKGWKKAEAWLKKNEFLFTAGKNAVKVVHELTTPTKVEGQQNFAVPDVLPNFVDHAQIDLVQKDDLSYEARVTVHHPGDQDTVSTVIETYPEEAFHNMAESKCEIHWSPDGQCGAVLCMDIWVMGSDVPRVLTFKWSDVEKGFE